jgi:GNAT superfamily N-acetyltransferase
MAMHYTCHDCGADIEGDNLQDFGDAFIRHVRTAHPDWPYPDVAVRNFAEATQRLTGPRERLPVIGEVVIQPVNGARLADWLEFFDHRAFADNPAWAGCYCAEPHITPPDVPPAEVDAHPWQYCRSHMAERLGAGGAYGYLAYVDGVAGAWVNASRRDDYALYRQGPGADPGDHEVIGVSCFVVAPPYRRHGLAAALLDRVIADAPERGLRWVEAYPFKNPEPGDGTNFRGPRTLFDARGFEEVGQARRHAVVRLGV